MTEAAPRPGYQAEWPLDLPAPVVVNQVLLQGGPNVAGGGPEGSVYISFGHAAPPVVITPEDNDRVRELLGGRIDVTVHGTFFMTRARAEEFADLLKTWLNVTQPPPADKLDEGA